MVGVEFIKYIKDLNVVEYVGVEDFADKLSFLYSVMVLMLSTIIISTKQYFSSSIACYIATTPSGSDFEKYLENYCWVHGTIPLLDQEDLPQNSTAWQMVDESHRINYYQWVPFMLGLQTLLFYTPRLIWQLICHNRTGTDLQNLITNACEAEKKDSGDRAGIVAHVANSIELMLYQHREIRDNRRARFQKKAADKNCGIFVASKRLGTWLICSYLFIKFLYLINAVGQIFLMQKFLGFENSVSSFGLTVIEKMIQGHDWQTSRYFPRISYCYVDNIRHLGSSNQYVSQCVLPINMLNEKLYIFLWFWTVLVAIFTGISLPFWVYRLSMYDSKKGFIKKFLLLKRVSFDEEDIDHFIRSFLRHDGVFLMRMIASNAGDIVSADIVTQLYKIHNESYKGIDFNYHPSDTKKGQTKSVLEDGGKASKN